MKSLLLSVCVVVVVGQIVALPYDVDGIKIQAGRGSCNCFPHHCFCEGYDHGTKVGAYIMVDEMHNRFHIHHRCCTWINAKFFINKFHFEKEFHANKMEDFCETVKGTRYCFRIDIHDKSTNNKLHGCLELDRPNTVRMGCFELPLMTSEFNNDAMIESESESDFDDELLFDPEV